MKDKIDFLLCNFVDYKKMINNKLNIKNLRMLIDIYLFQLNLKSTVTKIFRYSF